VEQWLGVLRMHTRLKHVGVFSYVLKVFYVKLYVHLLVDKLK